MYPTREEFSELIYYISELKHQYSSKIDEQTIKLNDQSSVIEELLWQIRELSDKLRKVNDKVADLEKTVEKISSSDDKACVCRYENHVPRNRSIFSRQTSMISRRGTQRTAKRGEISLAALSSSYRIPLFSVDKTIDDEGNDVYETIDFSDSSSHLYTEPVGTQARRNYGVLRKVSVKTSPKQQQHRKKPPSGIKKSSGSRNLQKYAALEDVSKTSDEENDPGVELRPKSPSKLTTNINSLNTVGSNLGTSARTSNSKSSFQDCDTASTHITNSEPSTQARDVSGILINFECLNSRLRSDFDKRDSY